MTLDAVRRQVRPPSPLAGRLSAQSLLFALGQGAFMTGSAVFFTQIVGLSAARVGLGLTCAGIAAFLAALPMGKLVDRFGPKKMWAVSATGQAAMFAVWPFIPNFHGYVTSADPHPDHDTEHAADPAGRRRARVSRGGQARRGRHIGTDDLELEDRAD